MLVYFRLGINEKINDIKRSVVLFQIPSQKDKKTLISPQTDDRKNMSFKLYSSKLYWNTFLNEIEISGKNLEINSMHINFVLIMKLMTMSLKFNLNKKSHSTIIYLLPQPPII